MHSPHPDQREIDMDVGQFAISTSRLNQKFVDQQSEHGTHQQQSGALQGSCHHHNPAGQNC